MAALRLLCGTVGMALAGVGLGLLLDRDLGDLLHAVLWLGAGVLAHDAVLAPVVIGLGVVAARVLPAEARGPFVAAGLVVGTVTLAVLPTLGRFGAKADDPTLLNRPYLPSWLLFVLIALAVATTAALSNRRRRRARPRIE